MKPQLCVTMCLSSPQRAVGDEDRRGLQPEMLCGFEEKGQVLRVAIVSKVTQLFQF